MAATVLLGGLSACGGSAEPAKSSGNKTFTYAMTAVPTVLDPAVYQGDPSRHIGFELGSTLFAYDTAKLQDNGCKAVAGASDVRGELAESWKASDDGKSIRVTLRDTKSAAGNQLTSADVKWSFDRMIALQVSNPKLLMFSTAKYEQSPIAPVDDKTFDIKLTAPTALDTAVLTWFQFQILDSTEIKKHVTGDDQWGKKWLERNSADFGPWQHAEADFDPGNQLTLTPNPGYTGKRGDVDKLIFKAAPDASSRMQLLQSGVVDYADRLSYDQYKSLSGAGSGVEVQRCQSADRIPLVLNFKTPAFANNDVRKAISMGIDRKAIIQGVYQGFNLPAQYGLSQAYEFDRTAAGTYTYDQAQAKQLIAGAGVGSISVDLTISPTRPGPEAEQIAVLLKSQLAEIGVQLNVKTIASDNQFATIYHDGSYAALLYLEPPAVADPFYSLNLYNTSTSYLNSQGYKNADYDAVTQQVLTTKPGPERQALMTKASEIAVQQPGFIYLVDKEFIHAVTKRFTNWQHPPTGELFVYQLTAK
ncbi:ABC transporter substrate-binding protein [Dactylosporangium salmoneum]|uniref:ABC transporter substrate-binding protein n=1 Tax=Dactylosporangium salmoneum TaxID=53361 RepID=A0ABN3GD47_9ACTN